MRSHVLNCKDIQPDIVQTLLSSLYVDDFNPGANTLSEAFDLCKFKSNNTELENQVYLKHPKTKNIHESKKFKI